MTAAELAHLDDRQLAGLAGLGIGSGAVSLAWRAGAELERRRAIAEAELETARRQAVRLERAAAGIADSAAAARRMSTSPTIHAADDWRREAENLERHAARLELEAELARQRVTAAETAARGRRSDAQAVPA